MFRLEYYEFRVYIDNREDVPVELLDRFLSEVDNKLITAIYSCRHLDQQYDMETNITYYTRLIELLNSHFNLELSGIEKEVCLAYLVACNRNVLDEHYAERFEHLINEDLDGSRVWGLREHVAHLILFSINQRRFDVAKIQELVIRLKSTRDQYEAELQKYGDDFNLGAYNYFGNK